MKQQKVWSTFLKEDEEVRERRSEEMKISILFWGSDVSGTIATKVETRFESKSWLRKRQILYPKMQSNVSFRLNGVKAYKVETNTELLRWDYELFLPVYPFVTWCEAYETGFVAHRARKDHCMEVVIDTVTKFGSTPNTFVAPCNFNRICCWRLHFLIFVPWNVGDLLFNTKETIVGQFKLL